MRIWTSLAALFLLAVPGKAQEMHAEPLAGPFDEPVALASTRTEAARVWVVERAGVIRAVDGRTVLPAPFLDIRNEIVPVGERGLFALAFHPRFPADRRCFVHFVNIQNATVVRGYTVADPPDAIVPGSGIDLFAAPGLSDAHRGGGIAFGPDGKLYVGVGDSGQWANGQSLATPHGKILRLDVDAPPPHVPADNPFTAPDDGAHDLIWAYGLRNPWRLSFDRETGDLWIADVGQGTSEEVDFQPANVGVPGSPGYQGGRNYGWRCLEGTHCTGDASCTCPLPGAMAPLFEVAHSEIFAIIGGFVYRGSALPALRGRYVYGSFTGRIWNRVFDGQTVGPAVPMDVQLELPGTPHLVRLVSFGEDAAGELCVLDFGSDGWVWRIRPGPQPCQGPDLVCTSLPNSTGVAALLSLQGSPCLVVDDVRAVITNCLPNGMARVFLGTPSPAVPFGSGLLCLGGTIVRLPAVTLSALGSASIDLSPSALPVSIVAGQTWGYQALYRDLQAPPDFVNTTRAMALTFGP